jgi:hypothetical protein
MLQPQKIESVIGMKMFIERHGISFPEGTGVFAGPIIGDASKQCTIYIDKAASKAV